MKRWIKFLFLLAGIGILGALAGYFFVYNKPHPDYLKKKPEFSLSATDLHAAYRNNETAASTKYNGKMLAVEGELSDLEKHEDLVIAFFIVADGMFGPEGVRVSLLPDQDIEDVSKRINSTVTIKGFCAGFNDPDVILEHGSLLSK